MKESERVESSREISIAQKGAQERAQGALGGHVVKLTDHIAASITITQD